MASAFDLYTDGLTATEFEREFGDVYAADYAVGMIDPPDTVPDADAPPATPIDDDGDDDRDIPF